MIQTTVQLSMVNVKIAYRSFKILSLFSKDKVNL
uniref:Uncharacterized protein n=1 Tax=Rhizophora mucronata TaxID=61149 RepID=A0A2P2NGJ9_RHIMU